MSLRGEYIWDGSYLIGADTEVDDMGHEAYIMSQISGTYGEDMTNALEEEHDRLSQLNNQQLLVDPIYKKLQQEGYDIDDVANLVDKLNRYGIEHTDPELIHDAYQMLKTMHPKQYSTPEITEAMNVLKGGDARYYGVKNYGYTIIRDDNFEVYGWNEKAAKSILNAIYEMAGEELNDPNSEVWDEEITIHDYQNNKSYTMTVRELEENPFKLAATPTALVQSKKHGMQYINPIAAGGSQNWQKQYTSESFSNMNFKQWLESEYTRDTFLHSNMDWDHPDIEDRRKAADTFIKGDYLDYLKPHEKENIKIINLPKNKRIVVSAYREPPMPMPIKNLDVQQDNWHGRKPIGGLWYAFGNDWIRFTESNMPKKLFMFIHEINVNTSNMIILNSEKEKRDFEIKYGWTGESDKQSGRQLSKYKGEKDPQNLWINWKDVEKNYGGFEIHADALDNNNWNWGWDIPSGCIWNKNALKDSKLLYVYNVKTKTYVKPNELGIYAGKSSKIKNPLN